MGEEEEFPKRWRARTRKLPLYSAEKRVREKGCTGGGGGFLKKDGQILQSSATGAENHVVSTGSGAVRSEVVCIRGGFDVRSALFITCPFFFSIGPKSSPQTTSGFSTSSPCSFS
jgi:hypothetical protein